MNDPAEMLDELAVVFGSILCSVVRVSTRTSARTWAKPGKAQAASNQTGKSQRVIVPKKSPALEVGFTIGVT